MDKDFFKYLLITNIFSRLDAVSIAISKCVCKSWLDLLETDEFVKSHLSRSAAATLAVAVMEGKSGRCTVFEFEDEYYHLTKFNFPQVVRILGSANGLLFLRGNCLFFHKLYVGNPISREYIELHYPAKLFKRRKAGYGLEARYGFGASKISGQHKVVRIIPHYDCHVYTLGTRSWRPVEAARASSFKYEFRTSGAFVNGNLHWLVLYLNETRISCFDLETECFSTFSVPRGIECTKEVVVSAFRDCLCLFDHTSKDEMVIWLMKEYGDEKSWTKEYVINLNPNFHGYGLPRVFPIKVFKNGDILMIWEHRLLFYYSNRTNTSREIGVFDIGVFDEAEADSYLSSVLLTPSFVSLKSSFPMENLISEECAPYEEEKEIIQSCCFRRNAEEETE